MFEVSFMLFIKYLILNIVIPFIPWLLFIWIFYWEKFKWWLLYLLSWFLWAWVVAFSLFNIQFIHFWVWIQEYVIILWLLIFIFIWKLYVKKQSIKKYISTLKLENNIPEIKASFLDLSRTEKIFTIIILLFSVYYICISWIYNFNLPTYAFDSTWNRNKSAYNIYIDWWIELSWNQDEILWRWRVWYPIYIPTYKALLSQFMWQINDIYFNTRQRLSFLFWLIFIFRITFDETKNVFKSILPIWLILWLPLVFFHSFEWYMDLPSTIYCIILIWLFYKYLESEDFDYLSLWLLFWFITSYIKNDWLVVYFPWILIALFITLLLNRRLYWTIKWFFQDKNNLLKSIWYCIYFFLPYSIIRLIKWLPLDPTKSLEAEAGAGFIESPDLVHREIFKSFKIIFLNMDNYNIVLAILFVILVDFFYYKKYHRNNKIFLLLSWLVIFLVFTAVFLFTQNYIRFLEQATVNRVYTMSFIITFAFTWIILENNEKKKRIILKK